MEEYDVCPRCNGTGIIRSQKFEVCGRQYKEKCFNTMNDIKCSDCPYVQFKFIVYKCKTCNRTGKINWIDYLFIGDENSAGI